MDEIDAIEIILGSDSLSDVIDQFDAIERMSSRDAEVVRGTRDFAAETKERQRSLRDQEQPGRAAGRRRPRRGRPAGGRARRRRRRCVADLRRQASFTASRIDRLDQAAQEARGARRRDPGRAGGERRRLADRPTPRARAAAATATPAAPPRRPPPPETPAPDASGGQQITVSATAYAIHGTTASGLPTAYGVCATDPGVIPMGTRFSVPGYGTCVAGDTGSAIIGNTIDVWFPELSQAQAWGRQTVTITILG